MPSVFDLVHESSADLKDRARSSDSVKVSLTKNEHIERFADETVGKKAKAILSANGDQLEVLAEKKDIDPDQTVPNLKEALLRLVFGGKTEGARYPDEGHEDKRPRKGLSSHYDDPTVRWKEVQAAAQEAAKKAVAEGRDYVVVEHMEPSRNTEPLGIQPAYMGTPRDGIVVFEAHAPSQPLPIINTSSRPTAPRPSQS